MVIPAVHRTSSLMGVSEFLLLRWCHYITILTLAETFVGFVLSPFLFGNLAALCKIVLLQVVPWGFCLQLCRLQHLRGMSMIVWATPYDWLPDSSHPGPMTGLFRPPGDAHAASAAFLAALASVEASAGEESPNICGDVVVEWYWRMAVFVEF